MSSLTLLINGLSLALALSFLLIILWQDSRRELNQFFAIFLFLVALWNTGALLTQVAVMVGMDTILVQFAVSILEIGFIGSSIAIYVLTTVLIGTSLRRFRLLAIASLVIVIGYRVLIIANTPPAFEVISESFTYRFPALSVVFYVFYDFLTLYLVWHYRRTLRSRVMMFGIVLFVIGQSTGFLNPELFVVWFSTSVSAIAALIISSEMIQQEIIKPLASRVSQVEAMHRVSLAVSSQTALDTVLEEITKQAVGWLDADAAGIFLNRGTELELETVHELPRESLHTRVDIGEGVAGTVAQTHQSIFLVNYERDWRGKSELPYASDFGSMISVPLIYGGDVIGVLMVITGKHGRLFAREDVHLLELLGAQAAVAIAHSRFLQQVEAGRNQLESLLVSTENPVVAVNRRFELIFVNPVARELFSIDDATQTKDITKLLPHAALPPNFRAALRDMHQHRVYIYEISLDSKVYLCHLAPIGRPRVTGWVAVMNNITQLKELDRLKSEMVRMTSHDLKNPLQAALANVELLKEDVENLKNEDIDLSVSVIEKQLDRMNRIIRGILDLERVKTGALTLGICRPARIMKRSIDDLRDFAEEWHITLEAEIDEDTLDFQGDEEQFERALTNLVENAIKFSPPGGHVWVTVKGDSNEICFKIRDTGIGIPLELQSHIFERFYRGRQKGAEHITGSGLGLSLVKTVVENHNGKIWLESAENQGTTFFVTVPTITV
jgi:two-component system, OmpR family, phosphate regulon sensor histidine kinase PhoR